jgi:hypothetical protein
MPWLPTAKTVETIARKRLQGKTNKRTLYFSVEKAVDW